MWYIVAALSLACVPIPDNCMAAHCAFGSKEEAARAIEHLASKTKNCESPPTACTPQLDRYAAAGPGGSCGVNELMRRDVARVCNRHDTAPFACASMSASSTAAQTLLVATSIATALLSVRALARKEKQD